MRFRARDDIGNVSAWSAATCTSTAVQDDAFRCPGNSLRLPSTLAAEGFYTRIAYPGAWCKLRRPQVGRTLGAWVIVGPGQGTLDAYSGSVRIGRVRLAAPTWGRTLVTFPMRDGIIKLVQHGRRPVGIDAVAVER